MSNIDVNELSKFAELAEHWWDKNGKFKSLHDINSLRVEYVENACQGLFGKQIIDIGCGGGIFAEALANRDSSVTGLDMVEASLQAAELHQQDKQNKVQYVLSTAEEWANNNIAKYDIVTCLEMLEHVPVPQSVVKACADMVKPGGKVIFSTLNRNPKSLLFAIAAAEYLLRIVPTGTHEYEKFIKPSELIGMIEESGLVAKSMTGLHYNPISGKYWMSDMNVDVNYFVYCEKPDF